MPRKKPIELTRGEWAILQAVWDEEPCAAPTVQEVLEPQTGWSYSTVKTMMDRMAAKGLLRTERLRNLILYRSAVSRREAQRSEVRRTVRRAFGGAVAPMMQCMLGDADLSPEELDELESLIRSKRGPDGNGRK
jgi:predicted transcriptional regulator